LAFERLALEVRVNDKGKPQALCWQCSLWFEAKTGLRIHKNACKTPMPICSERSLQSRPASLAEGNLPEVRTILSSLADSLDHPSVSDDAIVSS
jgi:hypothetical protein